MVLEFELRALPLETYSQPIFALVIFQIRSHIFAQSCFNQIPLIYTSQILG
jgi:hypothetical protein